MYVCLEYGSYLYHYCCHCCLSINTFWRPSAGEVDKIVLPEGMQSVNFSECEDLTGTAESLG